ncbi:MAG: TonB-dependent receptor [Tannerellaceae bacterium]|nr:TonB-dependent receptor [Tannerellaceae bacterium]
MFMIGCLLCYPINFVSANGGMDHSGDPVATQQTGRVVTGTVVDTKGEPLIGAAVREKGTTNGVVTDLAGRYTITTAGPDAVVSFSSLGYVTQEINVAGKQQIDVVMEEDVTEINEVIVVAYGTQKKSSVTGSIATLKADQLTTVTTPNVNAMLQGKVAGVQVLNVSGKPGNTSNEVAQIRIRGKGSLGSALDPLWVIDGVVSGIGAYLNPNEIATISVLKDAAATALYGSRATNGVIIVTTKMGNQGENRVEISAKTGVAQQDLGKFRLMNSQELYDYTTSMGSLEAAGLDGWLTEDLLKHNTDWFGIATQNALSQNYTVSYTTGKEKTRSFLMADYYTEEGTVKGYDYTRYSLRSNNDYRVNDKLTIKTKFSGSFYKNFSQQHDERAAMLYLPWDVPYNEDGTTRTGKEADWHGRDASNYLYNLPYEWSRGKAFGVTANVGFDYKFTDWLIFESNNNIGYRYTLDESYTDPNALGANEYGGSISAKNGFYTTRYTNQLLRFLKTFNGKHDISAFLGYEFSDSRSETNESTGRGIPSGSEILGVAANPYEVKGGINEWAVQSAFFNANYTYNNRYMAQFSYRLDGSSRFGKNNRYGSFFTFGAGWAIHEESFLQDISWINRMKLRASYGSIGNVPDSNYGYLSVYSIGTQYNGIPSAFPSRLGNPNLSWEKCYETNIALETRLFDRLNVEIEWYNKNTSDLLYNVQLSSVTGYSTQWQNVGAVLNRGVEITLSPDIVRTKDFTWTADLNIGVNKGVVKELYEGNTQIMGGDMSAQKIREEGTAIDTWYVREWAGVDVYTGVPLWYIYNKDADGNFDGTRTLTSDYSKATRINKGTSNPKFSGGLITSASYKNFTLSAGFSFVYGNMIHNGARQFYDNDGAYPTFNSMKLKDGWVRWKQPGDIATHPQPIAGGNHDSSKPSSRYLEDGSFLKMNNLSLTYSLPSQLLSKANIKGLDITLSGEKLFTVTKFSGPDPEVGAGVDNGNLGEGMYYPTPRRFSLGLNLTF